MADPTSFVPESEEMLKEYGNMSKVHRNQIKGAPTYKIWDNLSIRINDDSNIRTY